MVEITLDGVVAMSANMLNDGLNEILTEVPGRSFDLCSMRLATMCWRGDVFCTGATHD